MSSRKTKKVQQLDETTDHSDESDNESQLDTPSFPVETRRSKRLSSKKPAPKTERDTSLNASVHDVRRIYKLLRQPLIESFGYDIKEQDIYYLQDFFIELPKLKDIWKRIGFNKETHDRRLEKLYENLIQTFHDIIDSEEDLESEILRSIEEQKLLLNDLCIELSIKPSELKLKKAKSVLEEDDILRAELKNLEAEKHKRLSEYNELVIVENKFSKKLCLDSYEKRQTVPSQKQLNELGDRINELTELFKQRKEEMEHLKNEIIELNDDLEMSRSDSFAELIIMESIDDVPLGSNDLKRTKEFRDELRHKNNLIVGEIKTLQVKIRELWAKLGLNNESLHEMVMSDEFTDSKRVMVSSLREEHELCVKIKMENMQKFIESVRVEIKEYCEKMFIGPAEMKELNANLLGLTDYTEELLTLHEQKKEEMEFCYEESQSLFEKAAKWIKLWNDYIQFEEKTKDPARFKVRGYNMLAEEKQRKLFNSQLPKLENDLNIHAQEYATTNDRKEFTINGLYYIEFIQRKKQDHEESKMNERKEKQVMRDNMKKNESRYGSKPITPLALRNKRKLMTTHQESQMATPSRMKNSKIMKTESTPGTTVLGTSKIGTTKATKPGTRAGMQPKLSVASKRKSKTPAKNRFRKSRGALKFDATLNDTVKDKTAASSSSYQTINSTATTINSTVGSNSSRLTSASTRNYGRGNGLTKPATKPSKPPQSSSAKYNAASNRIEALNVLHSTASGTFIEEENFDDIENNDQTVRSTEKGASDKKKPTQLGCGMKFNYQHPDSSKYDKFHSQDINYTDFTRDLGKMQSNLKSNLSRMGGTTLSDRTNNSMMMSRIGGLRSAKATGMSAMTARSGENEKEKLTSTLLAS